MTTRSAKVMLSSMKLTYEGVGVVVANNDQGIITIYDLAQLNYKSVEGICQVLQMSGGTTGGCPIQGLQCQIWLKQTYKE